MNNKDKNGKIEFPIKFQVNASLTESNISGKIFNDDLEMFQGLEMFWHFDIFSICSFNKYSTCSSTRSSTWHAFK